jgi:hypothetical protein
MTTEDAPRPVEREWLLAPVGPRDVRVHVDIGEGAEISGELRAALDELMEQLHSSEVEGFASMPTCPDFSRCTDYNCSLGKCWPQTRAPCAWKESCNITQFGVV